MKAEINQGLIRLTSENETEKIVLCFLQQQNLTVSIPVETKELNAEVDLYLSSRNRCVFTQCGK